MSMGWSRDRWVQWLKDNEIPLGAYDYIIYKENDVVKAKNGRTGKIELQTSNYIAALDYVKEKDAYKIVVFDIDYDISLDQHLDNNKLYEFVKSKVFYPSLPYDLHKLSIETAWFKPYDSSTYDFLGLLVKLNDGTIIHVYRVGSDHISQDGKIVMRTSAFGKAWSDPITIYDSEYDDRNIGGGVTQEGTIIVGFGRFNATSSTWTNILTILRSTDGGNTWSSQELTAPGNGSCHGPLIVIEELGKIGLVNCNGTDITIWWSEDDGVTWTPQTVYSATGFNITEPSCVYLGDGKLIMLFTDVTNTRVLQMISTDYGETWSEPQVTNFPAPSTGWQAAIWLFKQYDKLMALWRHGESHTAPIYMALGVIDEVFNDSTAWYNFKAITNADQVGYPSAIELSDKSLLITSSQYVDTGDCDLRYKYLPPLPYHAGRKCISLEDSIIYYDNGRQWI